MLGGKSMQMRTHVAVQRGWDEKRCWCRPLKFGSDVGVDLDLKLRGSLRILSADGHRIFFQFRGYVAWKQGDLKLEILLRLNPKPLHPGRWKFSPLPGKESRPMVVDGRMPKRTTERAKEQAASPKLNDLGNKENATTTTANDFGNKKQCYQHESLPLATTT